MIQVGRRDVVCFVVCFRTLAFMKTLFFENVFVEGRAVGGVTFYTLFKTLKFILVLLRFPVPVVVPSFIGFSFSRVPTIVATFTCNPLCNVLIYLLGGVLRLFIAADTNINRISGFVLNTVFINVTKLVCGYGGGHGFTLVNSLINTNIVTIVDMFSGCCVICPTFSILCGLPVSTVLNVCRTVLSSVSGLFRTVLIFGLPFGFTGKVVSTAIYFLICGGLSPVLGGWA